MNKLLLFIMSLFWVQITSAHDGILMKNLSITYLAPQEPAWSYGTKYTFDEFKKQFPNCKVYGMREKAFKIVSTQKNNDFVFELFHASTHECGINLK